MEQLAPELRRGSFIRVKSNDSFRPGHDGMVMDVDGDDIGLVFHADRHNQLQRTVCVGIEAWHRSELDESTIVN